MNRKYTNIFYLCGLVTLMYSVVYAAPGKIEGYVLDNQTADPLPGANVYLEGTAFGAATDLNGKYTITNVPSGSYKLIVNYVGYEIKTVDITVEEGQTLTENVALDLRAIEGETIVVTAQAEGQMQAINQQLASDKIVNIVSESRIQELPDFNAAQALSRLPGISTQKSSGEDNKIVIRGLSPKYNSVEVEGVRLSATGSADIGLTSDVYVFTPGVRNDRSVDLTMISPYMIRMISVYKALTPDMNANSIGGTVNMELREAPSDPHWDLMWQQGYTAKSKTFGNYRGIASGSMRFFDDKLGAYALVNIESYDRNADNLNASYAIAEEGVGIDPLTGYRPVKVNEVTFNRHLETRERYGGNLILDYTLPNGSVKMVNMWARLNSDYMDHNQSINYNNGRLQWRLQHGENTTDQQLHSLYFKYDFGILNADLSASYTSANNELDDSPVLNFNQVGGVLIDDRDNLVPDQLSYLVQFGGDSNVILRSGNLFSNNYQEKKYTYKADFQVPFNIGYGVTGFFKFGGQYDNKSNHTDQEAPYLGFDGSALPTSSSGIANDMMRAIQQEFGLEYNEVGEFIGTSFLNPDNEIFDAFLKDKYGDIYFASNPELLSAIMNYVVNNPQFDGSDPDLSNGRQGGWYDGPYQQLANDYKFDADYYATYAMARINFEDLMVIGGVRYEKEKSEYLAYNARDVRNVQLQKMYDTTSVNENEFVLPMAQIKYSPLDWMDIRYAYTQTLARPDYQQLTPKFTITQANNIYTGNPDLIPAKAFNHDISLSFHNDKLGLFTIGAFYKTIKDFVYAASYRLDAAQRAGIDSVQRYQVIRDGVIVVNPVQTTGTVYRPLNNPFDATVKGIELDFQHRFWYLPAPFKNMVFGINYARIFSKLKYPFYKLRVIPGTRPPQFTLVDSSYTGRLIDQPDHVLNSYIGYDYEGFSARLSFIFQDNSARVNGGEYPENDSQTKEYFRVDFSARQMLPWFNSELFLDATNINDEVTSWVQKSTSGYQGIQNYGLVVSLGIRVRY